MYRDMETRTSYGYLQTVIKQLREPVCILGGWAIFFTVNAQFKKEQGRLYLGSKDIDIGFQSVDTLFRAMQKLEQLNFKTTSFRMYKAVKVDTEEDLSEEQAKKLALHEFFYMYVDLIISETSDDVRKKLGFAPIDEPLLKHVFKHEKHQHYVDEFGKKLLLPAPEVLLATKLNSIIDRDKVHKRIKDYCDIVALCLFTNINTNRLIEQGKRLADSKKLRQLKQVITDDLISTVAFQLQIEIGVLRTIRDQLI